MTAAAADPAWEDWLEFTPGWLAFLWTVGTLIGKAWTRRQRLALGPDNEAVRTQLTAVRSLFEDIISGARHADWFLHEDRREISRSLCDLADRRSDAALCTALKEVARAWNKASRRLLKISGSVPGSVESGPVL
jgi:hypothetical protein